MDVAEPVRSAIPSLDGQVLEVLSHTDRPLSGRDIARLARAGSPAGLRKALYRLIAQGVVHAEDHGAVILCTLNRDHLAYPAIAMLADLHVTLRGRLSGLLGDWSVPPVHASMFGSAARRDGDATSDIDILLVRPRGVSAESEPWATQVEELRDQVERWTGNRCQVYQVDPHELAEHRRVEAGIVGEWLRDSIALHGGELAKLLEPAEATARREPRGGSEAAPPLTSSRGRGGCGALRRPA